MEELFKLMQWEYKQRGELGVLKIVQILYEAPEQSHEKSYS